MKIFPWEWGHWLIFWSAFVQCPRLSRVGGGGAGIYFDWCINTSAAVDIFFVGLLFLRTQYSVLLKVSNFS